MLDDLLLKDVKLIRHPFDQQVSDRDQMDLIPSASGDLTTAVGRANLAQAILNRLLTRKGELAKLGHPNYGSRLYTLIGGLNNTRTRSLAELYMRESLAQESRIQEITQITFAPPSRSLERDLLKVTITVKPVGQQEILSFDLALNLGG